MFSTPINFDKVSVELLTKENYDPSFKCDDGDELGLNDFYHKEAFDFQDERLGATHQFRFQKKVIGFVTLAMTNIERKKIPQEDQLRLKTRVYPTLLIGRLASHNDCRGEGVGSYLCYWSIGFAIDTSLRLGCRYVVLETIEKRVGWYEGRGFKILEYVKHEGKQDTFWMYQKIDID